MSSIEPALSVTPNSAPADDCFHCGLALEATFFSAEIAGQTRGFCCVGCRAVAELISAQGLGSFYQFRDGVSAKPEPTPNDYAALDLAEVQQDFVTAEGDLRKAQLFIAEIRCAACVWLIEQTLARVAGVARAQINAANQAALIVFDPSQVRLSDICAELARLGYRPQPMLAHTQHAAWQKQHKDDLLRLGVAGMGMMQAGMVAIALYAGGIQGIEHTWERLLRLVSLVLTLPVIGYSAKPFFTSALRALLQRRLNMDVPVSLALLLAFGASCYATFRSTGEVYFDSVAMFTFLLLLGRYFEKRARLYHARARLKQAQLLPQVVEVIEAGQRVVRALRQVQVGQRLWVPPGSPIPCDGVVADGRSEVNEAVLTGEATPVVKTPGMAVIAGSLNGATALEVDVTAVGNSTQLAAIERLVNEAQTQKPAQVTLADHIAARFVAAVLVLSVVVGGVWWYIDASRAIWVVLSVLVVTCPCALGLATPTVLTAAINRLRAQGVLVTGANTLEALTRVDDICFDKTGTLTAGEFALAEVRVLGDAPEARVLAVAAALERGSAHPLARAFAGLDQNLAVRDRHSVQGAGVAGSVAGETYRLGTPAFVAPAAPPAYPSDGTWLLLGAARPLAWFRVEDRLREGALAALKQLDDAGFPVTVLSGDRTVNVQAVAHKLGNLAWHAGLLPADKLAFVRTRQQAGKRVLMVGDGINDVPVLAASDVAVAMGSATEFARHQADCILLKDDLSNLTTLLQMARHVRRKIKQNMAWALGYNLVALPLAVAGLVPPWAAAIGMSASSLVVVLNALRVGR